MIMQNNPRESANTSLGDSMLISVIRTLILYVFIIIAIRLMGKRQISDMQPSELVVTMVISDIASLPMQNTSQPLLSGVIPVTILVALEITTSVIMLKSRRFRKLICGNPVVGVVFGAVFTGVIQSSSASVGMLQALSMTGTVTLREAVPIIMGQNIGTCATALLSSVGVGSGAKRVAVIHTAFNIIGTAFCMAVFYVLSLVLDLGFTDSAVSPVGIAAVHSVFNIMTTTILFPFSKPLVGLSRRIVPD